MNNITHRQVMDRAGNRIEPPPMATYCEPSQRAVITSRTITGPGLKARPPMASYVKRAKAAQIGQREARERAEALTVMAHFGYEPFPPAPEMPAKLHQEQQPDPQSTPHYLQSLLLGILLGGAAAILFEAGRK